MYLHSFCCFFLTTDPLWSDPLTSYAIKKHEYSTLEHFTNIYLKKKLKEISVKKTGNNQYLLNWLH